jgi:hypothetical protein
MSSGRRVRMFGKCMEKYFCWRANPAPLPCDRTAGQKAGINSRGS